jgi:hypothetical protein
VYTVPCKKIEGKDNTCNVGARAEPRLRKLHLVGKLAVRRRGFAPSFEEVGIVESVGDEGCIVF